MSTYDSRDIVRQHYVLRAGPLKFAVYSVRDGNEGQHGQLQYHFTYDNCIMAMMACGDAISFANFIHRALKEGTPMALCKEDGLHLLAFNPKALAPMSPSECASGKTQFQARRGGQVLAVLDGPACAQLFADNVVRANGALLPNPETGNVETS